MEKKIEVPEKIDEIGLIFQMCFMYIKYQRNNTHKTRCNEWPPSQTLNTLVRRGC